MTRAAKKKNLPRNLADFIRKITHRLWKFSCGTSGGKFDLL